MAQMKYYYELTISSSPHVHSPVTTQTIMRDVLIALCPALIGSVYTRNVSYTYRGSNGTHQCLKRTDLSFTMTSRMCQRFHGVTNATDGNAS